MNFTKTTSYSLRVLTWMAQNENIIMSASHLHKQLNIPYSYLRSVLLDLAKKGLITGIRGRNGGFRLARAKNDIFLSEIVDAVEGLDNLEKCFFGFVKCPFNNRCLFHPLWVRMRSEIKDLLTEMTLADMLTDN
ncbi:MAG: Rrf2 family transcriptional regulator [Bacteroidales bacterium]|nr:Rrf2 family transcriptional regulator [Bacteroidales bacterium]